MRIRVEETNDGWVVLDFTNVAKKPTYQHELPEHVRERVSVLRLVEDDTEVPQIGFRVNKNVFYIEG